MSYDYDESRNLLGGLGGPRRPWQVSMTGVGDWSPSAATYEQITRILDLFPSVPFLTIKTNDGEWIASRDYPSGYTNRVDQAIESIFGADPDVIGIVFGDTQAKKGHTATRDDPHWSETGKASKAIAEALGRRDIDSEEAVARFKALYSEKG